jgi:hypothetical protein
MDRFMAIADPRKKAFSKLLQAELNECRERIALLTQGRVSVTLQETFSCVDIVLARTFHPGTQQYLRLFIKTGCACAVGGGRRSTRWPA